MNKGEIEMKKFMLGLGITLGIGVVVLASFPKIESAKENVGNVSRNLQSEEYKEIGNSEAVAEEKLRAKEQKENPGINMGILPSEIEAKSINLVGTWESNQVGIEEQIHTMTHQKVHSEFKQGAFEMNEENINALLLALDRSESNDEIKYYKEVLNKWKDGDFSNAVEVHNKLWLEQGGTIGKAERLLTPEEEQDFVERNFRS